MIKVNIKETENHYNIQINGHANFNDYGKDIVCASVSSVVFTTVNAIIRIDEETIEYNNDTEVFKLDIIKNEINKHLVENLITLLENIRENHRKNIEVNREVSK